MQLYGVKNKTHFIASIGHYDCITFEDMLMDGGQPGCDDYAGYSRFSSGNTQVYAEVVQTFGELYTDYKFNTKERKYGVWRLDDVRLLRTEKYPDLMSLDWRMKTSVWGTRGKNKNQPLKYIVLGDATTDHLHAILDTQTHIQLKTKQLINEILKDRKEIT